MTSGERIRELRIKNHFTLDDVARQLGVGKQAIYKYEQGTVTNIPLDNLEKMADMFGTTPEYLACWTNNPDPNAPPEYATTDESRIISGGIDRMPKEKREQALRVLRAAFAEYSRLFEEENNDDA